MCEKTASSQQLELFFIELVLLNKIVDDPELAVALIKISYFKGLLIENTCIAVHSTGVINITIISLTVGLSSNLK